MHGSFCINLQYDFLELNLTVLTCQAGYNLRSTGSNIATCVCTGAEDNSFAVLDCDDDNEAIILRVGIVYNYTCRYNFRNWYKVVIIVCMYVSEFLIHFEVWAKLAHND